MNHEKTKKLTTLAILVAMHIILSRFLSYSVWNMKIGFDFLPVAVAAVLYGPVAAAVTGGLGDFIGAILFPIGPYFPGYTLSAVLSGVVLGVFLYKKQTLPRVLGAVAINQWIISLLLTSFWISFTNLVPYWAMVTSRVPQCAIMTAVQIPVLMLLPRLLRTVKGGT
jgi:ECF transporter S component (folate family)